MIFKPKKDLIYGAVILIGPFILITLLISNFSIELFVICISFIVFSFWLWNSTEYRIENGELFIKCWIFKKRVKIKNIITIKKTGNILSSYSLSIERLEITENTKSKFYISPSSIDSFIEELKKNNPNIEIK